MKGRIENYRRGRKTCTLNQVIVNPNKKYDEAKRLMGKKAVYTTSAGRLIHGIITRLHGRKGKIIARFRKGMPGQALGKDIEIKD